MKASPGDSVLITGTLEASAHSLIGERAEVKAILRSSHSSQYLRLYIRTGPNRGREVSIHCTVSITSSSACTCSAYPHPHRAFSGNCKGPQP